MGVANIMGVATFCGRGGKLEMAFAWLSVTATIVISSWECSFGELIVPQIQRWRKMSFV